MTDHKITIRVVSHAKNGTRYAVDHDGEQISASVRDPLTEGARILKAMGHTGTVGLWRDGVLAISGDIEALSAKTVAENERHGPRFAKFVPYGDAQ